MSESETERLEVLPVPKGAGIEPEEAPARHVIPMTAPVQLSGPELPDVVTRGGRPSLEFRGATPLGRINAPVTAELPAGEVAALVRERCGRCANFRQDHWLRTKKIWEESPIGNGRRAALLEMIVNYARATTDGVPTDNDLRRASYALSAWGICGALTEERSDLVIVHPDACCPDGIYNYRDRDRVAEKEASAAYDAILRMAQGRR